MKKDIEKKELTKKSEDFSKWYTEIILKARLADYAPVKGCMVFRPYGYAIWENIQKILDDWIKKANVKNAYFPLFIPEQLLKKEKDHIEGFSPELAVVTIGGGKKLEEKLVVRPTSETIMYEMFSKWIESWRDLPFMVNQWCNVVRWEKRPRLFIRNIEFLWQEGHTVHASEKEALKMVDWALDSYIKLYREFFAIDGIAGKKSESEKFPGAVDTNTYEMLMPDGKVLQGCTSHDLGRNFSKAFNINFIDKNGVSRIPWQTSWGLSTRSIGALVMAHGDDNGLIIPPKIAPVQVIIIPVLNIKEKNARNKIAGKVYDIKKDMEKNGIRVEISEDNNSSLGRQLNDCELKGIPLKIVFGSREYRQKKVVLSRRDKLSEKGEEIGFAELSSEVIKTLKDIQDNLFKKSKKHLKENIKECADYQEFKDILKKEKGFIKAYWCEDPKCEAKIKEETKATTRVLPRDSKDEKGKCIYCGKAAARKWIFAQAY